MRAAPSAVWARARNWQSQRVTRRSFTLSALETVFQPVPSHNGQMSAGALITASPLPKIDPYSWAHRPGRLLRFAGTAQGDLSLCISLLLSTLHRNALFAQAGIADDLCTSCAGHPRSVEDLGKSFLPFPEGAPQARTGAKQVRNRLPARIFTVDILARESTIPAVRFPNPV